MRLQNKWLIDDRIIVCWDGTLHSTDDRKLNKRVLHIYNVLYVYEYSTHTCLSVMCLTSLLTNRSVRMRSRRIISSSFSLDSCAFADVVSSPCCRNRETEQETQTVRHPSNGRKIIDHAISYSTSFSVPQRSTAITTIGLLMCKVEGSCCLSDPNAICTVLILLIY